MEKNIERDLSIISNVGDGTLMRPMFLFSGQSNSLMTADPPGGNKFRTMGIMIISGLVGMERYLSNLIN